ncbi:MAG: ferritin-like protein [Blastocatellia bacterium]|nr:ferritin-like protein [Blastocatellia bacterium]
MPSHAQKKQRIVELLRVQAETRDLEWLKNSLTAAIELELATLPPYLCAYWSIKDPAHPAAQLVRSVLLEEMVHMGLVANMLTAIGGEPAINTLVPTYPGPLPGGIRPQLTVYLAGFSKEFLRDVCMQIEFPEHPLHARATGETFATIGAFYDAVEAAFHQLQPGFTNRNQLTAELGGSAVVPICSVQDVSRAILEIKEQGEGTWHSPEAEDFGGEFAHYYKFAQIFHGRKLVKQNGVWKYEGDPLPFPEVYPMGQVPAGGWPEPSPAVETLLTQFNQTFASLINHLQEAWATGSEAALNTGIGEMFKLKEPALSLMQMRLPDGSGTYGPDFRLPQPS